MEKSARVSLKQSKIFFGSNRNKLNLFWLFSGLFRETKKHFFWFVSVFWISIETTETNRIFSKQTEKISKKRSLVLKTINFLSRFQPKQTETQSVSVVFQFAFLRNQNIFFQFVLVCFGLFWFVLVCFDVSDRYQNNWNKQNLWYGELKRLIFYRICCCFGLVFCLFRLVFCLFRLFWNTETPCFDIKAKQPKQTTCFR